MYWQSIKFIRKLNLLKTLSNGTINITSNNRIGCSLHCISNELIPNGQIGNERRSAMIYVILVIAGMVAIISFGMNQTKLKR